MSVFVIMIGMIVGSIGFAAAARRRRVPGALVAAAAIDLYCGVVIASLGTMHVLAVVGRALAGKGSGPGGTFVYDFRFYSLVLFGVTLITPALAALTAVRRLTRGDAAGGRVAVSASLVLLALNIPLVPIQAFAMAPSVFALANLVALWSARKHFRVPAIRAAAGHPSVTPSAVGVGMLT
jgi:hypothetical protein